jgi:hypothetical protein
VTIENNLHYSEKQEYIELAKDFLADQITADDFSYSFMAIYEGINRKLGQMKRTESLELANFLKPSRPELGDLLGRIYGPVNSESVGHIVDLCYVPDNEKAIVRQTILQGARDKGSDAGILFLNDI